MVKDFSPEALAKVCGIDAATIRDVARTFARSERSIIFWGMGVSQHVHGTDNSRCLIALTMITGQIGRPGTGLHPLRGQNNVQGASDAGLIPMVYPDYKRSEEHQSELQSLMRISYAVFCLKKKTKIKQIIQKKTYYKLKKNST